MNLKEYFETTEGLGVLSTADKQGFVDSAVYSRPHVMEDGLVAFIMADRLSHKNLTSNPRASYLFVEQGPGYVGKRLMLKKTTEEHDPDLIQSLRRRQYPRKKEQSMKPLHLVYFKVENILPLVGAGTN